MLLVSFLSYYILIGKHLYVNNSMYFYELRRRHRKMDIRRKKDWAFIDTFINKNDTK